jgi:hypothetical protein
MFVGVQQAAALLSLPRLAYPQMVMLTRGRNTLNISAPMLSDAGTKPTTCQLCVKNGTVEAALFSPPRVPPLFVVLLWTVKRILGQNSLNSTVAMPRNSGTKLTSGPQPINCSTMLNEAYERSRTDQFFDENGTVEAALLSPPRVPPTFVAAGPRSL